MLPQVRLLVIQRGESQYRHMIRFRNVTRTFENTVALSDVTLDLGGTQVIGLLGLNGAGKTTLMRILTGTLEPTSGEVRIGAQESHPQSQRAKSLIGYLPEHCPLYDDMRVSHYLEYIAGLRGVRGDLYANVMDISRRLGLQHHLDHKIQTLSKGYRQRVGLAQALVHKPSVAVLDEPTSGLDPRQMDEIRELIKELATEMTIIFSTHNLYEVEHLCQSVVVLIRGRVGAFGTLSELIAETGTLSDRFHSLHQNTSESA